MRVLSRTVFLVWFMVSGFLIPLAWAGSPGGMKVSPEVLKNKKIPPPQVQKLKRIAFKPDLVVDGISAEIVDRDPRNTTTERVKVRVTVRVKNRVINSSTADSLTQEGRNRRCGGSFKVLLEWSDNPPAGYNYMCHAGVTALGGGQTDSFYCEQWFPYGASLKFKATVDYLNFIDESDENNNTKVHAYWAR